MRYLPILEELCSSDSILFMVAGIIVALVICVKFCDTKRNLIGLIGSFVVYAICEVLTNFIQIICWRLHCFLLVHWRWGLLSDSR